MRRSCAAAYRTAIHAAALLLAVSACRTTPRPARVTFGPEDQDRFAREVEELRGALRIPGLSVAVVRDGRVVLARGYGLSDLEAQVPATAETVYPIGSITKTFTATLMLQLAEQGRLDLEAPVARHVDWEVGPDVRVRHVLSHTSEGVPGSRFAYSSRFNWLDNVVESATAGSFRALLEKGVLSRAGLSHTYPGEGGTGYTDSLPGLARPYAVDAEGRPARSAYPPMGLHSSSGLSSTVLDLAAYSTALDEGRLLTPASRALAFRPAVSLRGTELPYGLGWFTQSFAGRRLVWHGSLWPRAYSGLLLKLPEQGLTLAALANSDALSAPLQGASDVTIHPLANAFLRHALGSGAARALQGPHLVAQALAARWGGEHARGDALLAQALACCATGLRSLTDADRVALLGESGDPHVQSLARDAGQRILADFPDDTNTMFNLGLSLGRVRREFRVQGPFAAEAVALFERILAAGSPLPNWMEGWSSYLVAESVAAADPPRALALAERARASKADTDGLQRRAAALRDRLGPAR